MTIGELRNLIHDLDDSDEVVVYDRDLGYVYVADAYAHKNQFRII